MSESQLVDSVTHSTHITRRHIAHRTSEGMGLGEYLAQADRKGDKRRLVRVLLAPVYSLFQIAHTAKQVH